MHHVIIGAGPAGIIAAETLRDNSPDAEVIVVGDEPEPPYSRMALPYYLVDRIDEQGTYLRKEASHYDRRKIAVRQDRVTGVDASAKSLTLASGGSIGYDRLLVASGSRPMSPPIPGIDLDGVHSCWTLEDARHIARLATPGARVVLMGAGFIGCIILEALASRGVVLAVVEMESGMVPRMMNQTAGGLIKRWCESKGVAVYTSTRAEAIERGGDGKLAVKLAGGLILPADLVITATGVRPNSEFVGNAVNTDVGILVNDCLQSSQPDIYAAGDVAQGRDFSTGAYSVQAIQPTAADHARLAALNMAGQEAVHRGSVNMNVLDTLGLISSSFGLWMGVDGGSTTELCDRDRYHYLNLQFQDDVLVGASSLGLTDHIGVLRGLIQSQVRLGAWKDRLLSDPTRVMEAYLASTQAVSVRAVH